MGLLFVLANTWFLIRIIVSVKKNILWLLKLGNKIYQNSMFIYILYY